MTVVNSDAWAAATPASVAADRATVPRDRLAALERYAPYLAGALTLGFFGLWTWMTVAEQYTFNHFHRDIAIYVNLLWQMTAQEPFQTTLLTRNESHLGEHVVPLLIPLSLLYRVIPQPWLLLVLQQAAVALAGVPIYLLARRQLPRAWMALLVLASFYLAPALTEVAWDYVHAVAFTMLPLAFGAYFLLTGRTTLGSLLACCTLLLDETSALALFGLGLLLLVQRQFRAGLILSGVAVAWLTLITLLVMPTFHLKATLPEGGNRTLHKYSELLQEPRQIPLLFAERVPEGLRWFLLPNAALSLLAPQTVIAALPTSLVLTFADDELYLRSNRAAPAIPLIWIATVQGLALLRGGWRLRIGLTALAAMSLLAFLLDSRLPGGGLYNPTLTAWTPASAAVREAIAAVPSHASVVSTQNAAAHLAEREEIKIFPFKYARVLKPKARQIDWWVLDVTRPDIRDEVVVDRDSPLRADPPYALWLVGERVLVATETPPLPSQQIQVTFGERLALHGYQLDPGPSGVNAWLEWRVLREPGADLTRVLEIVGPDGAVLARHEGPATRDYHPTSKWQGGQTVVEEIPLPLDAARLAGARLRIQWLEPEGRDGLSLENGDETLEIPLP